MTLVTQSPKQLYNARIAAEELSADPVQAQAVEVLDSLYQALLAYKPKKGWFSKKEEPPKGIYFYGGVGRGKSMLMDLFSQCLPDDIPVLRVHFHEFMISVHDYIHSRREDGNAREGIDEALPLFAARIAERARVLCFDEFHVVDIADAMILGRLYRCLFEHGVVIISTSNWEPDRLYEGGLQRDRFLPFIALIKEKMHVFHLDSLHDYRTQFLMEEGSYFYPLNDGARKHAENAFRMLADIGDEADIHTDVLHVKGRTIDVKQTANGVARFSFAQLCEQPLGAEDYLTIAESYHTVFLEGVPKMGYDRRNEIKRLMNFIDVLYENGIRLVMTADALPDRLYHGDDHAYEFERTISRLQEMQSAAYMDAAEQRAR